MTRRATGGIVTVALLAFAAPFGSVASANGRFPRAQQFLQARANPALMVLRTTFGVLFSADAGAHWEFWCEDALQYGDGYDPPLAFSADGTLLVALTDGLVATVDGCVTRRQPDLESLSVRDLATSPDGTVVFAATTTRDASPASRVARSMDNGRTFTFTSPPLPGVSLDTVETTADPRRLYASGTTAATGEALLLRSDDGGATWMRTAARFGAASGVYVSATDPVRADTLYLRAAEDAAFVEAGVGASLLLRSDDGGATVREIWRSATPMRGFARSGDGATLWAGALHDGVARSVGGAAFSPWSDADVECLGWFGGSLWACRTFIRGDVRGGVRGGALLARFDADGTARTVLAAADLHGPPTRCAAGTAMHDFCPARWNAVATSLFPVTAPDASIDAGMTMTPVTPSCGCATARPAPCWNTVCAAAIVCGIGRRRRRKISGAD